MLGTSNLIEALAPLEYERMVVAGSALEYGPSVSAHRENDPLRPATFRGAGKAAATLLSLQHASAERRPIAVLRLFSVYGAWESPSRLIPTAIRAALCGGQMALTAPGVRHDFVFIDDVVDAMLAAAAAGGADGEAINVGSGREWTNEQVVEAVQRLTGRVVRARAGEYPAKAADTAHWVADIGKAAALLGWRPAHDLIGGLRETIEWHRARPSLADHVTTAPR
jgi:nucleoside-diphosphate-sugar epimerase